MDLIKRKVAFAHDVIENSPKRTITRFRTGFRIVLMAIIMFVFGIIVGIQGERYFHPKDKPIIFEITPEQKPPYEYWKIPKYNKEENRKVQIKKEGLFRNPLFPSQLI